MMQAQEMTIDVMEYLVWIIEITATEFFNGDKTAAYESLKSSGLYQLYLDSYETTHTLGREYLVEEIKEYFAVNKIDVAFDVTSLVRMVLADLSEKHNWSYEETLDRFYKSNTCRLLSDAGTGMFTFAPREIIQFFEEEIVG